MNEIKNKMLGGIMGHIVGDALGVPVEFFPRAALRDNPVLSMRAYGTYNQPAGTWSDDTSMVLATMDSIIAHRHIWLGEIMRNFTAWVQRGAYTPYGTAFDVGGTTREAITLYKRTGTKTGLTGENSNGNGSLMRIMPVAFYDGTDREIDGVSSLTHAHERSMTACRIFARILRSILFGVNLQEAINVAVLAEGTNNPEMSHFCRVIDIASAAEGEIKSSGYVVDTLEAALWCAFNTDNYKDCVLKAVNLGGDTDTIGAIAGSIAGVMYGFDAIPAEWVKQLANLSYIESMAKRFVDVAVKEWN